MHKSNAFIYDSAHKTDKLLLLKYVLCATSEVVVADTDEKIFHPMRSPDFVVLEAIIVFFKDLFLKYNYSVRVFSRMFCHFQIVSIVQRHVAGFPLIMTHNRQTQDLRKALRGKIGKLYHKMWGFADDLISVQIGSSTDKDTVCVECAECVHKDALLKIGPGIPSTFGPDKRVLEPRDANISLPLAPEVSRTKVALAKKKAKKKSYDTLFLKDWKYVHENIANTTALSSDETGMMPGHSITCRHHLEQSVVSYAFYHKISHGSPKSSGSAICNGTTAVSCAICQCLFLRCCPEVHCLRLELPTRLEQSENKHISPQKHTERFHCSNSHVVSWPEIFQSRFGQFLENAINRAKLNRHCRSILRPIQTRCGSNDKRSRRHYIDQSQCRI